MTPDLTALVVRTAEARLRVMTLRVERGSHVCERNAPKPCWKHEDSIEEGYYGPVQTHGPSGGDFPDWCPTCQARQAVHVEYTAARRRFAGMMSQLWRAAEKAGAKGRPELEAARLAASVRYDEIRVGAFAEDCDVTF